MSDQPVTAGQEWRANWLLVLSAMAALSFTVIPMGTLGLFMAPLQQEFSWSSAQISLGVTIFAVVGLGLGPFAGALVDKYGPRSVAIPGMVLTGSAFAAFSLLGPSYSQWIFGWVIYSVISVMVRSLVFTTAVGSAFTAGRGMALAVLLCGTGIGTSAAPIAAHWLIESFGWRGAYLGFGLGWGGVVFLLLVIFFHIRSPVMENNRDEKKPSRPRTIPGGITLRQAFRSSPVLRITFAVFLQAAVGAAIIVHGVPLLVDSGLTRGEAAGIAALYGIGSIAGKLATGALADRTQSTFLPFFCFLLPGLGYFLLWQAGGTIAASSIAMLFIGYGSGAAIHMTAYLTTQYAGLRHYGKIYGVISSLMGLASGLGPLAAGLVFDATQTYSAAILIAIPAAVIAAFAVLGLGAYPKYEPSSELA